MTGMDTRAQWEREVRTRLASLHLSPTREAEIGNNQMLAGARPAPMNIHLASGKGSTTVPTIINACGPRAARTTARRRIRPQTTPYRQLRQPLSPEPKRLCLDFGVHM